MIEKIDNNSLVKKPTIESLNVEEESDKIVAIILSTNQSTQSCLQDWKNSLVFEISQNSNSKTQQQQKELKKKISKVEKQVVSKIYAVIIETISNNQELKKFCELLDLELHENKKSKANFKNLSYGILYEIFISYIQQPDKKLTQHKINELFRLKKINQITLTDLIWNFLTNNKETNITIGSQILTNEQSLFLKQKIGKFLSKKSTEFQNHNQLEQFLISTYPGILLESLKYYFINGLNKKQFRVVRKVNKRKKFTKIAQGLLAFSTLSSLAIGLKIKNQLMENILPKVSQYSQTSIPLSTDSLDLKVQEYLRNPQAPQELNFDYLEPDTNKNELSISTQEELRSVLEELITSLPENQQLSVTLIPLTGEKNVITSPISINEQQEFEAYSLSKLLIAGLILKEVSMGTFNIDEPLIFPETTNPLETIEQALTKLITNSDNQAQVELTRFLLYKYGMTSASATSFLSEKMIQEFRLDNSYFTSNSALSFRTNSADISSLATTLLKSNYLGEKERELLFSLMHQSTINKYSIISPSIAMNEQTIVSEKIALGILDDNNMLEMHSTAHISASNGEYLLVIMSKGHQYELQPVIENITKTIQNTFNPELQDSPQKNTETYAHHLTNDLQAKEQYITILLNPYSFKDSQQETNKFLQFSLPDISDQLAIFEDQSLVASADGSKAIFFNNLENTVVLGVDNANTIRYILDSQKFTELGLNFSTFVNKKTNQPFQDIEYEASTATSQIQINLIEPKEKHITLHSPSELVEDVLKLEEYQFIIYYDEDLNQTRVIQIVSPNSTGFFPETIKISIVSSDSQLKNSDFSALETLISQLTKGSSNGSQLITQISTNQQFQSLLSNDQLNNLETLKQTTERPVSMISLEYSLHILQPKITIFGDLLEYYENPSKPFPEFGTYEETLLKQYYLDLSNFVYLLNETYSTTINIPEEDQFIEIMWDLMETATWDPNTNNLTIPVNQFFEKTGIDPYKTIVNGNTYNGYIFVPTTVDSLDVRNATNPQAIISNSFFPQYYFLGLPEQDQNLAESSYQFRNSRLLYQYTDDEGNLSLSLEKPELETITAVFPLEKPISAYEDTTLERLVKTGIDVGVSFQFHGNNEYAVFNENSAQKFPLYFDPTTFSFYIWSYVQQTADELTSSSSFTDSDVIQLFPFFGFSPELNQVASWLQIETTIGTEQLVAATLEQRFLLAIEHITKQSQNIFIKNGSELINTGSLSWDHPNIISCCQTEDGKTNFTFDSQLNLIYHSNDNRSWIFDQENAEFSESREGIDSTLSLREALLGFSIAVNNENTPLHYKGFPLLIKNNSLYIFDVYGIRNISTIENIDIHLSASQDLVEFFELSELTSTTLLEEPINYRNSKTVEEKILHSLSIKNPDLIFNNGLTLFDPSTGYTYELASENSERLVKLTSGSAILINKTLLNNNLYYVNTAGEFTVIEKNETVPESEFLEKYTPLVLKTDLNSQELQAIDRFTRLPVYTQEESCYILTGSGISFIGNKTDLIRLGLIGTQLDKFTVANQNQPFLEDMFDTGDRILFKAIASLESEIDSSLITKVEASALADQNQYIEFDQIPREVLWAIISSEDQYHFSNSEGSSIAVSSEALLRTVLQKFSSGGSTIAQQTARNIGLPIEKRYLRAPERKLYDWIAAYQLNKELSPEEMLEIYVNVIYYGDIGISEGSLVTFGKPIQELNLAETALLTVIPKDPIQMHAHYFNSADSWADTASGVIRRMNEQGFISLEQVQQEWKNIYSLVEADSQPSDINFINAYAKDRNIEIDQEKLNSAIETYKQLDFSQRLIIPSSEGNQYADLFYFLSTDSQQGTNFFTSEQVEDMRSQYYNNSVWKEKINPSKIDFVVNNTPDPLVSYFAPLNEAVKIDELTTELNPYTILSMQKVEPAPIYVIGDHNDQLILRDSTNTLYITNQNGLIRLPNNLMQVNGQELVVQTEKVLLLENSLELPDNVTLSDTSLLRSSSSGDYYLIDEHNELDFYGRKVYVQEEDKQYLVPLGEYREFYSTSNKQEWHWMSLLNSLEYSQQSEITTEELSQLAIQGTNNPNIGPVILEGISSTPIINPTALQTVLTRKNIPSTVFEFDSGFDHTGKDHFQNILTKAITNQKSVLVWLNTSGSSLIHNFGTEEIPFYEQVSNQEYPVTVVNHFTIGPKTYVVYADPGVPGLQTMELETFTFRASPTQTNRYKMLVLGEMQYSGTDFQESIFNPFNIDRQVEMALQNANFDLEHSPLKEFISIDSELQNYIYDIGKNTPGNSFDFLLTDQNGVILAAGGVDNEGNPLNIVESINRPLPAGSIFKIVSSMFALHNNLDPEQKLAAGDYLFVEGQGYILNHSAKTIEIGNQEYVLDSPSGVPKLMDMPTALATSNNVYFSQIGQTIDTTDPQALLNFAQNELGISSGGKTAGFSFNGGYLPFNDFEGLSPEYAEFLARYTYFGQYGVNPTALEMIRVISGLANNGQMSTPSIVANTQVPYSELPITPIQIETINTGLYDTSYRSYGTLSGLFSNSEYTVYLKTGTAEHGDESTPTAHIAGWAVSKNDPTQKILISIRIENGGSGAFVAGPIAKQILDHAFALEQSSNTNKTDVGNNLATFNSQTQQLLGQITSNYGNKPGSQYEQNLIQHLQVSQNTESQNISMIETPTALPLTEFSTEQLLEIGIEVSELAYSDESIFSFSSRAITNDPEGLYGNIQTANYIYDSIETMSKENSNITVSKVFIDHTLLPEIYMHTEYGQPINSFFNVVASIGNPSAQNVILLTSHFDTQDVPQNLANKGASDNGWTTLTLLKAIEYFSQIDLSNNTKIIVAFTNGEELNLEENQRSPGTRAVLEWLMLDLGINQDNIIGINLDSTINVQQPISESIRIFNAPEQPTKAYTTIVNSLETVYTQTNTSTQSDRPDRWGDQMVMSDYGIPTAVRIIANSEAPINSIDDSLPETSTEALHLSTGKLVEALIQIIKHLDNQNNYTQSPVNKNTPE